MPVDPEAMRTWFNKVAILRRLNVEIVRLEPGHSWLELKPTEDMRNPNGAVNGALLSALIDQAGGAAVSSLVEPDEYPSTMDLAIHFLTGAFRAPIVAECRVLRRGRRHAWVTVEVRDAEGKLCAHGTGTWALQGGSPNALGPLLPGVL